MWVKILYVLVICVLWTLVGMVVYALRPGMFVNERFYSRLPKMLLAYGPLYFSGELLFDAGLAFMHVASALFDCVRRVYTVVAFKLYEILDEISKACQRVSSR